MGEFLLRLLRRILHYLPVGKTILFESNPDFACNTYPVFRRMQDSMKGYRLVWLTKKRENCDGRLGKGIYAGDDASFLDRAVLEWYLNRCNVMISSNVFQQKRKPKQVFLFLTHGSKTKKTRGLYEMGDDVDFINVQSHFFDDIITYEYNCKKEQLVYLGYPRCDCFFSGNVPDVRALLHTESNEKYVIWLPTFRKMTTGKVDARSEAYNSIGMPIVYSIEKLGELNDFLKSVRLHILYKPHPKQDLTEAKSASLSNFHFISDDDVRAAGLQLYEVIGGSEALITDYSSVFFDYLLLDHPIATTTDDIEEWKNGRGFAFDIEKMYDLATCRVKDQKELLSFLSDVSKGIDRRKEDRRTVRDTTNMHIDGNSAERVVAFIRKSLGMPQ